MDKQDIQQRLNLYRSYAKSTCRKCYGKGYNLIQYMERGMPIDYHKNGPPPTYIDVCDCAKKNYAKVANRVVE